MSPSFGKTQQLISGSRQPSANTACPQCQHKSAYVSIRQHTSTSSTCRQHCVPSVAWATCLRCLRELYLSAHVSIRQHTSAYVSMSGMGELPALALVVSIRQHAPAHASIRQHTPAYASIRGILRELYLSAYASIRQHAPAYVSMSGMPG